MFDAIAPRYELVNHLLTFGMDRRWRRRAVKDLLLVPASTVLDVASGTGDFTREAARQGLAPIATDLSFGMLAAGRTPFPLVQADASCLPFRTASFDGLTCGYALRNFTDLQSSFNEMARVIRPGGRLSIVHWKHDPATPRGPSMHIRPRPEQCRAWVLAAGFAFLREPDLSACSPYHYGLLFARTP